MAWYSSTFALLMPPQDLAAGRSARDWLNAAAVSEPMVHSYSRNGVLLRTLESLLQASRLSHDLYLLRAEAILSGDALRRQHEAIAALLAEVEHDPQFVLDATRTAHVPEGVVHVPGVTIRDGWVYQHSREEVRALLASARGGADPKPAHDDEGESLEYLFGFLKAHAGLLQAAIERGCGLAYAEMNPRA